MSRELKWWHLAVIGGMGAGGGYLLMKDRWGKVPSAGVGALASMLTVLAFRPGGWLRQDGALGRMLLWTPPAPPVCPCPVAHPAQNKNIGPALPSSPKKLQVNYRNHHGIAINATGVLYQGGTAVGHVVSQAGVASFGGVSPGAYKLWSYTLAGQTRTINVTIPATGSVSHTVWFPQ